MVVAPDARAPDSCLWAGHNEVYQQRSLSVRSPAKVFDCAADDEACSQTVELEAFDEDKYVGTLVKITTSKAPRQKRTKG